MLPKNSPRFRRPAPGERRFRRRFAARGLRSRRNDSSRVSTSTPRPPRPRSTISAAIRAARPPWPDAAPRNTMWASRGGRAMSVMRRPWPVSAPAASSACSRCSSAPRLGHGGDAGADRERRGPRRRWRPSGQGRGRCGRGRPPGSRAGRRAPDPASPAHPTGGSRRLAPCGPPCPRRWSAAAVRRPAPSPAGSGRWTAAQNFGSTREKPASITTRTPSMVRLVSAMEVASTTLRRPGGGGAMARSCRAGSSAP